MSVQGSEFSGNKGSNEFVTILVMGILNISNSNIGGNTAQAYGTIQLQNATMNMANCTVANNSALSGGGIFAESSSSGIYLRMKEERKGVMSFTYTIS
jgi:predicted outer membrane repeat protein